LMRQSSVAAGGRPPLRSIILRYPCSGHSIPASRASCTCAASGLRVARNSATAETFIPGCKFRIAPLVRLKALHFNAFASRSVFTSPCQRLFTCRHGLLHGASSRRRQGAVDQQQCRARSRRRCSLSWTSFAVQSVRAKAKKAAPRQRVSTCACSPSGVNDVTSVWSVFVHR